MQGDGEMVWGVEPPSYTEDSMRSRGQQPFGTFEYTGDRAPAMEDPNTFGRVGGIERAAVDDDVDLPILEELGIHPEHIKSKALGVLNPFKIKDDLACQEFIKDEDLAGPLCFALLLGFALMLEGKMHFGHIYAYGVTGCLLIYGLLNLMCDQPVGLQFTLSILGYNILPLCFLAFISSLGWLLLSSPGFIVYTACAFFIAWSAWCSTQMFVVGLSMNHQRWLIFYPMILFYTTFALITIF